MTGIYSAGTDVPNGDNGKGLFPKINRRKFLQMSAAGTAGLVIAATVPVVSQGTLDDKVNFGPNDAASDGSFQTPPIDPPDWFNTLFKNINFGLRTEVTPTLKVNVTYKPTLHHILRFTATDSTVVTRYNAPNPNLLYSTKTVNLNEGAPIRWVDTYEQMIQYANGMKGSSSEVVIVRNANTGYRAFEIKGNIQDAQVIRAIESIDTVKRFGNNSYKNSYRFNDAVNWLKEVADNLTGNNNNNNNPPPAAGAGGGTGAAVGSGSQNMTATQYRLAAGSLGFTTDTSGIAYVPEGLYLEPNGNVSTLIERGDKNYPNIKPVYSLSRAAWYGVEFESAKTPGGSAFFRAVATSKYNVLWILNDYEVSCYIGNRVVYSQRFEQNGNLIPNNSETEFAGRLKGAGVHPQGAEKIAQYAYHQKEIPEYLSKHSLTWSITSTYASVFPGVLMPAVGSVVPSLVFSFP